MVVKLTDLTKKVGEGKLVDLLLGHEQAVWLAGAIDKTARQSK